MRKKNIQWLYNELPKLVHEGILSAESASTLRRHYGAVEKGSGRSLALIISSILGATLIGLGVILLVAHNWENLSRPLRIVLSFTPLIIGQIITGWVILRRESSVAWREGSSLFLMAGIGVSIALISQTYHLPGDMASFLLVWMLLSVPLVYLVGASMPAALYMVGITAWAASAQQLWGQALLFWPLLAIVLPHLWTALKENPHHLRPVFLCWTLTLCLCVSTGIILEKSVPGTWIVIYSSLFALFCLIQGRWFGEAPTLWQRPFLVVGTGGVVVLSLLFTYSDVWRSIGWEHYRRGWHYQEWAALQDYVLAIGLFALAAALLIDLINRKQFDKLIFGSIAILSPICYLAVSAGTPEDLVIILFNLYLFSLGGITLLKGLGQGRLGTVNGGLFILSMLIVARFFDAGLSFTLRGILFILIGAAFLVTNIVMKRREATP